MEPKEAVALKPDRILEMGFGFFAAKTLMTSVDFDVFTILADGPLTQTELGQILELHPRGIQDFFDALVALKLLTKEGTGPQAKYRNSAEADRFLSRKSDYYLGGILSMSSQRLYRFWNDLGEGLRTGKPQSEVKYQEKRLFDEIFTDQSKLRNFCEAMAGLSRQNFEAFTALFPFQSYGTHLDVGASTGLLSRLIVQKYPHIKSVCFDLPEVCEITSEFIDHWGVAEQVKIQPGNFMIDPLPAADVITMGNILHDWNLEQKKQILKAAYQALNDGGALVIIENLIDDERRENAFGLLMSLNMLIEFGDAFDFTFADFKEWCGEIGFQSFEKFHVYGPCSAAIAYK